MSPQKELLWSLWVEVRVRLVRGCAILVWHIVFWLGAMPTLLTEGRDLVIPLCLYCMPGTAGGDPHGARQGVRLHCCTCELTGRCLGRPFPKA